MLLENVSDQYQQWMESFQTKLFGDSPIIRWPQIHKLMCSAVPVCHRSVCPQSVSSWAANEAAISHCRNGHHGFQWPKMLKLCSWFQDHWKHFEDPFPSIIMEILSGIVATEEGLG